jgi:hypothetical protein
MVSRIFVFGLLIFGLYGFVSGQSGRRVKSAPVPASTPQVQQTQDAQGTSEAVGYSESAPNAPRSISPNRRIKPKKDSKKQPKSTAASQPVADVVEEDVVKVETNLVTIPVSVFDRNGLYIPNLRSIGFQDF